MVDRVIENCKVDPTYRTIIKRIDKKGYVILDETGQEKQFFVAFRMLN